jgi:thiol-disulfide isomerase/thioredoxin
MRITVSLRNFTAAALLIGACIGSATAAVHVSIGAEAPALITTATDGRAIDLGALHGSVVLLNLWASWCPPCRAELPLLADLQRHHREDGLIIIALSADRHRDRADAVRAVRGLDLTVGFMDGARVNGYADPEALPYTYLIDATGRVRAVFPPGRGALDASTVEAALEPLLHKTTQ